MGIQNPVVVGGEPADFPTTLAKPLPLTAGGTAVVVSDATADASLASIDAKTPDLGQAPMAGSVPVTLASDQSDVPVVVSGRSMDAFCRMRISNPVTLFDSTLSYGASTVHWQQVTAGGGTVTSLPNSSAASLNVGTTAGDSAIRQTKGYWRYQPGKSQLILMTGVLGAGMTNCRRRLGYFDAQNGLFFQLDGTSLSVVRRSFTSGLVDDTVVAQANWNLDPLNGSGPSGITLDTTKDQIFIIDFQWLGAGRARMGFDLGGHIVYCHQFSNANVLPLPYMTTGSLPCRYEIANTGTTAGANSLIQVCVAVVSEGGAESTAGFTHTASNGITGITVTTRRPVLSIRPKTTFNGVVNRAHIVPMSFEIMSASGVAYWELVWNGVLTTTPSWTSAGASSLVEYDVASTVITGGTVLLSGFVPSGSLATRASTGQQWLGLVDQVPFTLDITGAVPDTLSLVLTSFTGSCVINSVFNWEERR